MMHSSLERAARESGSGAAVLWGDEAITYAEMEARSRAFAGHLAALGVGPGDRVAVMMSNRPEFVVAVHALSKLGAAAVLISPAWKAREVGHAVAVARSRRAVCDATTVAVLSEVLDERDLVDVDAAAVSGAGGGGDDRPATGETGADALLVFSSGTTGMPKAARHTHRTISAAVDHWRHCLDLGPADRFQVSTPPSHILGLLNLLTAIEARATVRLHRRFDLDEILSRITSDRLTLEMAVAPIALALANHPDLERYDLSSLRYIMWGATPVTASVAETVTRRTGVRWLPAYGATEVPVIAANPVADPARWRLDSAGLAAPGIELRVVDLATGEAVEPGGTGEIQVRGASVMAGYLPEQANAEAFSGDWYRTGDVGWIEAEGWVHLTDRAKEMIKVSGFQVAPAEIEAVLHGHPGVVDCAVFGVPDPRRGEAPVAAVQIDPDHPVIAGELMDLVSRSLASYKGLRHVMFVDSVPRLPSGKVLRRQLRDEWSSARHAGGGR